MRDDTPSLRQTLLTVDSTESAASANALAISAFVFRRRPRRQAALRPRSSGSEPAS